ncbi:MAG: hypothetical protein QM599_01345 [Pseudoxanthomonas sp.]
MSGGSNPVTYSNQLGPTLSATPDAALLLIERIEKRIEKLDGQLSSHHDELVTFKASFNTLVKVAGFIGVALSLWLAYLSLEASRKNSAPTTPSTNSSSLPVPSPVPQKASDAADADSVGSAKKDAPRK